MTVLLGPNNGGKTTVLEALSLFSNLGSSIPEGYRNSAARFKIATYLITHDNKQLSLERRGTNMTASPAERVRMTVVPARRRFKPLFNNSSLDRSGYADQSAVVLTRNTIIERFGNRLVHIQQKTETKAAFDSLMARVIHPVPDWYVEERGDGNYYMKVGFGNLYHDSEGLGEGVISLLFLVESLFDSAKGDVILVDEPELSLHPAFQSRIFELFKEFSHSRQIVYATHSPYFFDWESIENGGRFWRVYKDHSEDRSRVATIKTETWTKLQPLTTDINNPHVLGLDARNALFLDDRVILVEGQEDVVCYKKFSRDMKLKLQGDFFGWGAGGASKIPTIARMLTDLGYQHLVAILDNNKPDVKQQLEREFPQMKVYMIPTENVRDKNQNSSKVAVGVSDERGVLKSQYTQDIRNILQDINDRLTPKARP